MLNPPKRSVLVLVSPAPFKFNNLSSLVWSGSSFPHAHPLADSSTPPQTIPTRIKTSLHIDLFTVAVVLTKTLHRTSSSYAPQVQSPETTQTHTRLGAYRLRRGC